MLLTTSTIHHPLSLVCPGRPLEMVEPALQEEALDPLAAVLPPQESGSDMNKDDSNYEGTLAPHSILQHEASCGGSEETLTRQYSIGAEPPGTSADGDMEQAGHMLAD
ncbi:hypothetical protein CC1G_14909 [Coprinopsis cinerea okayama7|uniref:Uncharacterized protein n=1 Tax=Coprinopsis cinerea (strain Okayama-7 / 130 / ATCC MYA-4618 / FGSC 9003) TaxID=240176 RepID=D6RNS2_COPC7|nr:hypothetical protein CC1G_14909 [Coprinopsis cinerea okayama7\|eukprot:XP_002910932.1 hypothetical protein CC1G_14909 [Coprinopsis cinerea okayama7\